MTELTSVYHSASSSDGDGDIDADAGDGDGAHLVARYIRKATTAASMSMLQQQTPPSAAPSNGSSSNLAAAISSMRSNVPRILHMYFQNASEELVATTDRGYTQLHAIDRTTSGINDTAATPTTPTTTTTWSAAAALAATAGSSENCSALFANYTQQQPGAYCNWAWDTLTCWPPTSAGVLAHMHCPAGYRGVDTRKFATRKCELNGHWGGRPNETDASPNGWTDYGSCYKPEVTRLMQQIKDMDVRDLYDIAKRVRTLEMVGLCLSLLALIISLVIFCNFRSLRNNRTKIHKNLFIAMVLQVIVRLTLYLDQAFQRGQHDAATNTSLSGIENTPYLCEASYVLMEYARTAMFMWMFIEGLYLHNMVTVAVFQGSFPHKFFSLLGWGMPVLITAAWALCTAIYMDTALGDCMWHYNLTPYYWILEGPRVVVILLNFCFLVNIIRVLVVKLRQSQASDIEQTRKAVRAAIVLLPLLGITNLLHLVPDLKTAWKFALWSYGTYFLTSFQGFFIALIYCFLNGEVRAVLLKSLAVYMSVRGHPEWAPKRASMYSGAYNTAPDTDALQQPGDALPGGKRVSPPNKRLNYRKGSCTSIVLTHEPRPEHAQRQRLMQRNNNHHVNGNSRSTTPTLDAQQQHQQDQQAAGTAVAATAKATRIHSKDEPSAGSSWMIILCFRGQKNKCVMPGAQMPQQIFMTPQLPATTPAAATATAAATTCAKKTTTRRTAKATTATA